MNEEPKLTEGDKGNVRVFCIMNNIPIPEWAMSDTDKPDTDKENDDDNTK